MKKNHIVVRIVGLALVLILFSTLAISSQIKNMSGTTVATYETAPYGPRNPGVVKNMSGNQLGTFEIAPYGPGNPSIVKDKSGKQVGTYESGRVKDMSGKQVGTYESGRIKNNSGTQVGSYDGSGDGAAAALLLNLVGSSSTSAPATRSTSPSTSTPRSTPATRSTSPSTPAPKSTPTTQTVSLTNNTGYNIFSVYISPTGSGNWGGDRLEPNQILLNGQSNSWRFPVGSPRYDIRLVDEDGDTYTKMNVPGNSRVVFNMWDVD